MAFTQETAWSSATVGVNVASSAVTPSFVGGGSELLIVPLIVDTSNGCSGATLSGSHLNAGASYVATAANGYIIIFCWGVWTGPAGGSTITATYSGGNSGATGGKIQQALFTGQLSTLPSGGAGPSSNASGSASPAAVTLTAVGAGSLSVALMNNVGAHNWSAGTGYTLAFNTSAWSGNVTGLEYTTGLSEAGGNPIIQASFPSGPSNWNMMAVNFPVQPTGTAPGAIIYSQRKVLYFI